MRLLVGFLFFTCISPLTLAEGRVALPVDYQKNFTEYLSLDRVQNPDQVMRIYANDIAMQGTDENGLLANGSVVIGEVYSAKKNSDGTVKISSLGRRIEDQLLLVAVMEKQAEFGQKPGSVIKTGDWDFAAFTPDGDVAKKNLNECRACHAPLQSLDYLFSTEHLPEM
ncbi:cytochrome P460 family protein [Porticoccus sp. GXU_MW_L64]